MKKHSRIITSYLEEFMMYGKTHQEQKHDLLQNYLFKESKNFLRGIRRRKYPENIKRAFSNMIADIDSVGWLKTPKDLRKIDKIKHMIRLKIYIKRYADKKGNKNA